MPGLAADSVSLLLTAPQRSRVGLRSSGVSGLSWLRSFPCGGAPASRKGTSWGQILQLLAARRLFAPGVGTRDVKKGVLGRPDVVLLAEGLSWPRCRQGRHGGPGAASLRPIWQSSCAKAGRTPGDPADCEQQTGCARVQPGRGRSLGDRATRARDFRRRTQRAQRLALRAPALFTCGAGQARFHSFTYRSLE